MTLYEAMEKAATRTDKELIQIKKNKLEQWVKEAAYMFYLGSRFMPKFYKRTGSLYNILTINENAENVTALLDARKMSQHERGASLSSNNLGLYETVYQEGWHGGAKWDSRYLGTDDVHPNQGTPYYRTPYKKYSRWGNMAVRSDPPEKYVLEQARIFREVELPNLMLNIFSKHYSSLMKEVRF